MRVILSIALLLMPLISHTREIKAVKIFDNNKGAYFPPVPELTENAQIFVYSKGADKKLTLTAIMKVVRCDLEECEARVTKIRKGSQIFTNNFFSTINIKTGKGSGPDKSLAFATYGGPLTKGYNFGYLRRFGTELRAGLKGGLIDAEIGKVAVSGRYFGVQADFVFMNSAGLELSAYGELGYMQTTLDFAKIDGPEFDENIPYAGIGANVWKYWDSFFLILKGGYAHNFFETKYSDENADYSLPFSGGLIVFELGAGLTF